MSQTIEIKVPDIGDYKNVPVIDILVSPGDTVSIDQSLLTLESDKATIDIPSPFAGIIQKISVKSGDLVSEGSVIALIETVVAAEKTADTAVQEQKTAEKPVLVSNTQDTAKDPSSAPSSKVSETPTETVQQAAKNQVIEIKVPDIGDYQNVPIIDVLVGPGDTVIADQSIITLESDKATIDIPSPAAGVIQTIRVKAGETVSEGSLIAFLEVAQSHSVITSEPVKPASDPIPAVDQTPAVNPIEKSSERTQASDIKQGSKSSQHASPSIRKFTRELGVDISRVTGTGPKGRVQREDVTRYIQDTMKNAQKPCASGSDTGSSLGLLPWPKVDFSKWGKIETRPLSRIKKLSGANLHRNWVMIPHVTNQDEADITDLEAFRIQLNKEHQKTGQKATLLAFILKACVAALKEFPEFNSSLDGDTLVYKQYYHLGFAADTPNGLVVPVIQNADQKGILELAQETAELAALARTGKLKSEQMQGSCFSISSLGGIGGTGFTPIINAPEVAILGVSRGALRAVWDTKQQQCIPRLIVPLSLSYDHRVIDGAQAARFNAYLVSVLGDLRRILL